ncbi:ABC transporter ATP-binding protein [Virgibacillus pantothenticus]|uniref:ABC transporter ATP-binding protein n=1 Tax=Virgibacillus pantothenticus TaxID=1473 RepID=UPI001C2250CB|nr:ABC transporter ATP-binding protein [Virgibacillus pantothenticus]MBU8566468.1 ABC transporter ATP-binding protein [Virgibacillus pantothenticus]MBU8600117.1 ABC transporter ATP-binding protein [Virgibacillus pantothenticus]MBU8633951.1 ABC transporter ATP-binding protein [Virgibacillus pantothenticus]MBU8641944.1 ABC transporter ATP-binding protein [Virgibacillus pantothenticus]MBU8645728.1 ABC transporter ATP-binding protein [Virgibacillus pantothenticus]
MNITLNNISMQFAEVTAVDRLSVTIEEGSLVSLLGPSGCGKSTTLFMLAGLYQPTSGELYFCEQLMNKVSPEKRQIGMVFQNYALYPHMTVLKNIMFPLKMAKVAKKEARESAIAMAELVQIGHLLERKPSQLSGGQQQRVAIARALVKKPKLLLLDEPLSNLDARLRLEMREEIRRIQQTIGITTVFVTHDQEEALSISDKILLMKDGKYQQYSDAREIYEYPQNEFVGRFLGNPPMNQLPAVLETNKQFVRLEDTDQRIAITKQVTREVEPQEQVIVGVRPEDLFVQSENEQGGITGETMMVERIGRDNLLNIQVGKRKIRAIVSPDTEVTIGKKVTLGIRPGYCHLFHADTGESLLMDEPIHSALKERVTC